MASVKRRLVWLLPVAVILAAGFLFLRRGREAPRYVIANVDRGDVVEVVGATGALEAVTTVQIGSQVSGTIQSLHADFNSTVTKGQVIARLDPSLFEARLGQAKASLLSAKANVERAKATVEDTRQKYERAKELAATRLIAETDLETAKANYDGALAQLKANEAAEIQAQANVHQAEVDLSHTIIATPIDGVVISRNVDVGQTVAASFQAPVLFLIANDLSHMRVNASVDEADVGRVREGQEVTFRVDSFPERTFTGTVEQVRLNPTTVQNVVTYNAIVAVDNREALLRPGMTATVSIVVRKAEGVLRIPAAALRFRPEGFERPGTGARVAGGRAEGAFGGGGTGMRTAGGPRGTGGGGPPGAMSAGAAAPDRPGGGREGARRGAWPGAGSAMAADGPRTPPAGGGASGPSGDRPRGRPSVVFVPDAKGEPKPVDVRLGVSDGQFVEVRDGLEEGATVIAGTEIPGAPRTASPRPGASPSASSPFQPQFQRRQR